MDVRYNEFAAQRRLPHDKTQVGSKSFAYAPFGLKTTRLPWLAAKLTYLQLPFLMGYK